MWTASPLTTLQCWQLQRRSARHSGGRIGRPHTGRPPLLRHTSRWRPCLRSRAPVAAAAVRAGPWRRIIWFLCRVLPRRRRSCCRRAHTPPESQERITRGWRARVPNPGRGGAASARAARCLPGAHSCLPGARGPPTSEEGQQLQSTRQKPRGGVARRLLGWPGRRNGAAHIITPSLTRCLPPGWPPLLCLATGCARARHRYTCLYSSSSSMRVCLPGRIPGSTVPGPGCWGVMGGCLLAAIAWPKRRRQAGPAGPLQGFYPGCRGNACSGGCGGVQLLL